MCCSTYCPRSLSDRENTPWHIQLLLHGPGTTCSFLSPLQQCKTSNRRWHWWYRALRSLRHIPFRKLLLNQTLYGKEGGEVGAWCSWFLALPNVTFYSPLDKRFLALLFVASTEIPQHQQNFFSPLSEYLKCFREKPVCSGLVDTGALLVKQLGNALTQVLGALRGGCNHLTNPTRGQQNLQTNP